MENQENISMEELIKEIPMYKVASSNISAIGYSPKRQVLRVIFGNNSSYLYFNVEPIIWDGLIKSHSKGKYLTENITKQKDKYRYLKVL